MIWSRETIVCALAVSLLNSVWQGGVLGLVGVVLGRRLKKSTPEARVGAYSLLLFTMFAAWAASFFVQLAGSMTGQISSPGAHFGAVIGATIPMILVRSTVSHIQPYYPLLTMVWAIGVIVLTLRHMGGFLFLHRLYTQATEPCLPDWNACARRLADQMGIKRTVTLRCSSHIDVPCVFWMLRSCILLPLSAMARLSPDEVQALIAHELAHIARHDVLFNFIQVCIETILFYHPTVWWLSMQIRAAREERCDDLALRFIADRTVYARALLSLEEARSTNPQLALGAKGEKSAMTETMFLRRIRRVLGVSTPDQLDPWAKTVAAMGAVAVGLIALHPVHGAPSVPPPHNQTGAVVSNNEKTGNSEVWTPTNAYVSNLAHRHPKDTIMLTQAYFTPPSKSANHSHGLPQKEVGYRIIMIRDGKQTVVDELNPGKSERHNFPTQWKRSRSQSYGKIIFDLGKNGVPHEVKVDGHHKTVQL